MSEYTKYVVDAPKLEKGQNIGAGGVRRKGKMVSQFKNPVPLEQHLINNETVNIGSSEVRTLSDTVKGQLRIAADDFLKLLWSEYCCPLMRGGLQMLAQKTCYRLYGSDIALPEEVIEADFETIIN